MSEVTLSRKEAGSQFEVPAGAVVVLRLPENPSTGYQWEVDAGSDVDVISNAYLQNTSSGSGGGGVRELRLLPKRPGVHRVVGALRRAWAPDSPVDSCEFGLRVHGT